MRPRVILAAALTLLVVGAAVLVSAAFAGHWRDGEAGAHDGTAPAGAAPSPSPDPTDPVPEPSPSPSPLLDPAVEVEVDSEGFFAWAARDRTTGVEVASDNADDTTSTESMIKVWVVADYLRQLAEDGDEPSDRDLSDARKAIRDSHNSATQRLYAAGGYDEVVERMIDICELADTHIPEKGQGWWSRTEISARDAVELGECVWDGRAAGPEWTGWVLEEMRNVRGTTDSDDQRAEDGFEGGRWGIIDALPDESARDQVAIKNGWTQIGRTNSWHLNCLAVTEEWVMAVLMRYPAEYSLDYGAERCAEVAEQLLSSHPPERGSGRSAV